MFLHLVPAGSLPPLTLNFNPLGAQQPFASSLTPDSIRYNLTMIADQGSVLFLFRTRNAYYAERFIMAAQITLQRITQLHPSRLSLFCFLPPLSIGLGATTRFLTPFATNSRCNQ